METMFSQFSSPFARGFVFVAPFHGHSSIERTNGHLVSAVVFYEHRLALSFLAGEIEDSVFRERENRGFACIFGSEDAPVPREQTLLLPLIARLLN